MNGTTTALEIISVRQQPEYKDKAIKYFQQSWSEIDPLMYEDCITHSIGAEQYLPQWYLLMQAQTMVKV